jgi:uncharacterized membrane protein
VNPVDLAGAALPAFVASLVECVEALTIVLAAAVVAGWRAALTGALAALVLLVAAIVFVGPSLALIPERPVKLVVGALLLAFGIRWLRKAILRAGGALSLRDEARAFERARAAVAPGRWSGAVASFGGVLFEGIEVAFIVIALGRSPAALRAASAGAGAAALAVAAAGFALHGPLTRVPENALKMFVGIVLSAIGTTWVLEGVTGAPLAEYSIVLFAAAYALAVAALVRLTARRTRELGRDRRETLTPPP